MFRLILFAASCLLSFTQLRAEDKPNIIFIFADDWGWGDLSCHGHPYVKTPNIDRLAAEGTDFHRFTVASGVCSPSRTAVMTGHFPAKHGISGHFAWPDQNAGRNMPDWLNPNVVTLPRILQSAGYATAHYGKWHISNNMIPDSPSAGEYGYDDFATFNASGEQMPFYEDVQRTNKFIKKSQKEGKPFFINLWVHEPHTPHHVVPKYQQKFPELEQKDNIYASILAHADERIGELLDLLDALEIADNTLVIFSSDNGPAGLGTGESKKELGFMYDSATGIGYNIGASVGLTAGRRGAKASLFEGGVGVPFLARWPQKIAAGAVDSTSPISAVDLLPTFVNVAGAKLPEGYESDGVDQTAVLLGEPIVKREKLLFWKGIIKETVAGQRINYAVSDGQWKLLANNDSSYIELIDLTVDIYEKNDLKAEHPEIAEKFKKELEAWKASLPAEPDSSCFSKYRKVK